MVLPKLDKTGLAESSKLWSLNKPGKRAYCNPHKCAWQGKKDEQNKHTHIMYTHTHTFLDSLFF